MTASVTSRFSSGRSVELIATGVPSLDTALGGGFPVGSIVLISEDELGEYSDLFYKAFCSQGVVKKDFLFLAAPKGNPPILKSLPAPMEPQQIDSGDAGKPDEPMTIAWRYGNSTSPFRGPKQLSLSQNFTFNKNIEVELLKEENIFQFQPGEPPVLEHALQTIRTFLTDCSSRNVKLCQNVHLRVAIRHLGSALWRAPQSEIPKFLLKLRRLLMDYPASAVVTLPSTVFADPQIVSRCQQLSDIVLHLESIDPAASPAFSEYNGLLQVKKVSPNNSLVPLAELTSDWAFKLVKRRLLVERLTLPPELDTSTQREQVAPMCSSRSSALDF